MFKCFAAMLCACVALAGCDRVDADSPLGKRQALFKQMLQTSERMGGMLRGRLPFDGDAFAQGAVQLDGLAHEPWQHFPTVREEEGSNARPELWQRQARFDELARALEAATAALRERSDARPLKAAELQAPMTAVENACKACHQAFRNH